MHLGLNNKTILVVGGSGYIGRNIIREALKRNYQVTSIGLKKNAECNNLFQHIQLDISKKTDFKKLKEKKYNYVINLGGYVDHSLLKDGGIKTIETHFYGLINLINHLDLKSISKFIQIGSSEEYGLLKAPQSEDSRELPVTPYGFSKLAATHFLQMLARSEGLPVVILRLFLVYGGDQERNRLIPYVIENSIINKKYPVTDGDQIRDFCHIDDLVEAIFMIIEMEKQNDQIYNIGSGTKTSIKDVILKISSIVGSGEPEFGALINRKNENMKLFPTIKKIKSIGWRAKKNFDNELIKLIEKKLKKPSN